jgi:ABC-type sugar transport system substrate-binding protein
MHHIKHIEMKTIRLGANLIVLGLLFSTSAIAQTNSSPKTTLAISIRTLSSPYQVMYKVGAEAYAKQIGLPLDVLTTEANSQKTSIKSCMITWKIPRPTI